MHELRTGHAAERSIPRLDLTKVVNKPSSFDGSTGSFHEWKNEVQMYLRIMNFSSEQEVGINSARLPAWYSPSMVDSKVR